MQAIQDKQFRLNDAGQVLFQPDSTNPLPGTPFAALGRGAALLSPVVTLNDGDVPPALADRATAQARVEQWLAAHLAAVIGPLVALAAADEAAPETPVAEISRRLHDALGIVPRADIDDLIARLDQDGRRDLRNRRVRLGPVLVSMPDLNKPAAVRLRALLWTLWHEKPLPAAVPPDGMVSLVIEPAAIDPVYYRSIGYPVYARRAIRVDMLDRVISAIYDNADKGVFKARHEMAEWLGCPIAELYEILTAMGHTKISDPADNPAPAEVPPAEAADAPAAVEPPAEIPPATADEATAEPPTEVPVPVPQVKPELATFRLRRGRAHDEARPPREGRPAFRRDDKPHGKDRQNDRGKDDRKRTDRKPRPDKKAHGRPRDDNREPRIVASAEAHKSADDSPFAILNQLKVGRKE